MRYIGMIRTSVRVLAVAVMAIPPVHAQQAERVQPVDPSMLPRFEVASIKPSPADWKLARTDYPPGKFVQENQTLGDTLTLAFDVARDRIARAPEWIWQERFSIDARMPPSKRPGQDRLLMVRALLIDRFKLPMSKSG